MAGKRKRRAGDRVIEGPMMTPMIDVVFQLLIYFIVTIKPIDISAHLDVFRPSAHSPPPESLVPPKMIQIKIFSGALLMNERSVDMQGLEGILGKLGAISKNQTVVIMCARDSEHEQLINVLDRCAKAGLDNLSVVSMN